MSFRSQTVEQQNLCHQFSEITQASPEVAASILRKCKWNIRQAIEVYWESADFCSPAVDSSAIEALFDKYKDSDDNAIGVDGLINFCNDLEIPPDDLRMLYFCYNLKAKSAVRWTNAEFVQGLKHMRSELSSPSKFKDFYAYAFDISRQDGQKVLDLQTAIQLWRMLLEGRFDHLDLWCEYLEKVYNKAITKDTWQLTLEFSQTVNEDFSNIDLENSAWPVVIDEFVEYCRAKVPS
ncbi:hypothetical protein GUITHDRAFT_113343 [Guillardia theta CCMP2712]|uniref:Defective in cullin neddylation protein n=1 Tax=Guillardia theta (strain CCMP2712) TaxID=905079 RepID=L1IWR2_GUITC|nr:hypothetical protein GUITHDRAFT_113343 [Guillardia theta CCMP2712]EKX40557.1 hypothetical protein GUITHDRAFT_113343 [Guillardia theta CCMP2712]|eukprot:XP_005827537.1 hypothetical protein GUITHDRAFT_113343 [Guillardia theta CCMP2712]